ncbi:TetR/AcrR family transcriptional regulator [Photobacterium leiognathi]|uniref:TetR/AcrR family transcriptional regulator n=1 Tax=Photobacterium leiognathi TaxID=553611 RepID=UPI001EE11F5E|nr:TetR/AcrR family transcriptional regulator [Photobacterium leiognathi]MCG3884409.1 TetR/AcrR family transcriptional regulator [Photobacterium leiognathi]
MRKETTEQKLNRIHEAAINLIETRDVNSISIYDISREAGIASSTIYHHYPKVESIFEHLMTHVFKDFDNVLYGAINPANVHHWSDINKMIEGAFVDFYRKNKMVQNMLLCPHTFSSIRSRDLENDIRIGQLVDGIYRQYFDIPKQPEHINIFTVSLQLADRVYSLDYRKLGYISEDMAREAIRVTEAYLSLYIPNIVKSNIDINQLSKSNLYI